MKQALTIFCLLGASLIIAGCGPRVTVSPFELPQPTERGIAAAKALPAPYNTGDAVAGREAFAVCAECHDFLAVSGGTKGPSLRSVVGARAAARSDFTYSEAMRSSGIVWDARRLDHWMFNPREAMPGTSMGFIGVRNDAKRRDILGYLAAVSAETEAQDLPSPP